MRRSRPLARQRSSPLNEPNDSFRGVSEPARLSDVFRRTMVVTEVDIDELGHASNIAYLRWVQEVAKGHSAAVGLGYPQYQALGSVFVVRRHEIDYLRSALAGDTVELATWVESWSAATSVRQTRIVRGDADLARAATTWALINTASGRPRRIPELVKSAFARGEGGDAGAAG